MHSRAFLSLIFINSLFGQLSFSERSITDYADGARSVHAVDMDNDGDVDILSASYSDNTISWYENNGSQSFTKNNIVTASSFNSSTGSNNVFGIDLDSDGDMDVISSCEDEERIYWYENNGSQSFVAHALPISANGAKSVYALDMDNDGDVDILSASYSDDKIAWYENNGSQGFSLRTISTSANGAYSVYALDIDKDGDIDVLSASHLDDKIAWYENHGSENFTARTISSSADGARSVYALDIDKDGDIDVLSASNDDGKIAWYQNDGSQNFTSHTISSSADGAHSVYAIDVDGDGDIDVLSASNNDDKISWYQNNGSQVFTENKISETANYAYSVFAIDVDMDGDIDVLSASGNDNKIAWYENTTPTTGTPTFTAEIISTSANFAYSVYAADVDTDGDMDVLSASGDGEISWYDNNGSENFTENIISTSVIHPSFVYAADVDTDGDMDVVYADGDDAKIAWFENNGSENFTAHTITASANDVRSIHVVDIDRDGDMDVVGSSYGNVIWCENNGTESFTTYNINLDGGWVFSVYAEDVDGDGDIDVLAANTDRDKIVWYENDGSENFTDHTISASASGARSVYAKDVDGDGDMDVLSANVISGNIVWYDNDGSENFTDHTIASANGASSIYAVDVDSDGDIDVLSASRADDEIAWYENDGSESFTEHVISTSADWAQYVYAVDIDNDGDIDVLSASGNDNKIAWYESSPPDLTAPSVPTGLVATPGNAQNVLTWTANSESDLASYKVYGGTSSSPSTLLSTVSSGTETYTHSSLTNGTLYYYRITSVDNNGNESSKTSDVSSLAHDTGGSYSLSFDGTDDYVQIQNDEVLNFNSGQSYTISLNVKTSSSRFPLSSAEGLLAKAYGVFPTYGWQIILTPESGNPLSFNANEGYSNGGTYLYGPTGSAYNDGDWHNITITYNYDSNEAVFYFDGSQFSNVNPVPPAHNMNLSNEGHFKIATDRNNSGYFGGNIDDVAIWNDALTSSEITALYNSGTPLAANSNTGSYTSSSNLRGYWRFNENTGNTAYDLSGYGNHGAISGASYVAPPVIFIPATKEELQTAVNLWVSDSAAALTNYGYISVWDVSLITDMDGLFQNKTTFNSDISAWDVSNVTDMDRVFYGATIFNQDLSSWNLSSLTTMSAMFRGSAFNQDISGWDVSNVTNMRYLFKNSSDFNQDISSWNVSSVTNMEEMFYNATSFNQDISSWDVSNVTDMDRVFYGATIFNQDLSDWDMSSVATMDAMFYKASNFNGDLSTWNVSSVNDMSSMFREAESFNQDISSWDVSSVTTLDGMFNSATSFNQDISSWDVSNVTDMDRVFYGATIFNQDLSSWNLSSLTTMEGLFSGSAFNQDISGWDVSNVTDMNELFNNSSDFNQDISGWDVSSVTDMGKMFYNAASFNQDISDWDVSSVTVMENIFYGQNALSDINKCLIHTSFLQENENWPYDWSYYCYLSDDINSSLFFDGVNDRVSVPYSSNLNNFTNELSISAWVKVLGNQGSHRSVITNGDQPRGFRITVSDQNKFRPHVQVESGWAYFDGNITVELNTWYNVIATYDNNSNLKLYVNGVLDSMFTEAGNSISGSIINNDGKMSFGFSPGYGHYFNGNLDDIAVWDDALTSSEITALYNSGTPLPANSNTGNYASSSNLRGYWRFNENTGGTAYDLSGNENHGTIVGASFESEFPVERGNLVITVNQDGSGDFQSIQNAILSNSVSDRDTILVFPGTYFENILFGGKNIVLKSVDGATSTILKPNSSSIAIVRFINNESSGAVLSGFTIEDGGSLRGSAIKIDLSSPVIENCIIKNCDNTDDYSYAAIATYNGAPEIRNCLVFHNTSGLYFNDNGAQAGSKLINSTIANNYQRGIISASNAQPVITNSIICNNYTNLTGNFIITHSVVEGGHPGAGNINIEPQFIDDLGGDYRLSQYSPAIGSGTINEAPSTDIEGNPRPMPEGSSPDIGAYESPFSSPRPLAGVVRDGTNPAFDLIWSSSMSTMYANWSGFSDNDVLTYEYAVGIQTAVENTGSLLYESFNDLGSIGNNLPNGWSMYSTSQDGASKDFITEQTGGIDNSPYIRTNIWLGGDVSNLMSPQIGPINPGDYLSFYYRAIGFNNGDPVGLDFGDGMKVFFESPNGGRYPLWSIDDGHNPTTDWQQVQVSLSSIAGENGFFIFEAIDNGGNNDWYACFDEVRVVEEIENSDIDNVISWTYNGVNTSVVIPDLSLVEGETYSVAVRAKDTDNQLSDAVRSDGVTIDASPPEVFDVAEGYINMPETTDDYYSLSFDGVNDYVIVPYHPSHDLGDGPTDNPMSTSGRALSIAAWIYPVISAPDQAESTILMKGQYGYGFALTKDGPNNCSVNNAPNLVYWDQGDCYQAINSDITYEFNQWQHVAVTVEDIGSELEIYFYVNGVQDGPFFSPEPSIHNGSWNWNPQSLRIGDQGGQGSNPFSGNISSLSIWDYAQSETRIAEMAGQYGQTELHQLNNPVLHWDFSDGSGSVITDQSVNGNDGNISGASWTDNIPTIQSLGEVVDIDFQSSTNQVQAFWDGYDEISGIDFFEYSLGSSPGTSNISDWQSSGETSETLTALNLAPGQKYYLSVRSRDNAGNISDIVSSDGFTIDLSPPVGTSVNDGPGSDISFSSSDTSISGNWVPFTDAETQIEKYEISIGTQSGATNTMNWTDNDTSTYFTKSNLDLTHGSSYFVNVRATDEAGNLSNVVSSDGLTIDTEGPENNFLFEGLSGDDLDWTNSTETISAYWSFYDLLSGIPSISAYQYSIGNTPGGNQIADWTPVLRDTFFTLETQPLVSGTTYYTSVRARDNLGNWSDPTVSDGITVDIIVPTVGVPLDGSLQADQDWQSSTDSIHIYWTANDTRNRQMDYFEYAVSTTPGDSDIVAWTNSGGNSYAVISGLSLSEGTTYYGRVRAYDSAGNRSTEVNTNGITIDSAAPVSGEVIDGQEEDIDFTPSSTELVAEWSGFSDGLSGVSYYEVALGTSAGGTNIVNWENNLLDTAKTFTGLNMVNGQSYYVSVRAFDQAMNQSETISSNGVISDQEGPVPGQVFDALLGDKEWTISASELEASWVDFEDQLSGIQSFEYAVIDSSDMSDITMNQNPGASNLWDWIGVELQTEMVIQGLNLNHREQYFIALRAVDSVGNIGTPNYSNGLRADLILPQITGIAESEMVIVVSDNEENNDSLDVDYMNQSDKIVIGWAGGDSYSGIASFETSLGTTAGEDNVLPWQVLEPNIFSKEYNGLGLEDGLTYYSNVRATDIAGNISEVVTSDGVLVDMTPPQSGEVIDGIGIDQRFTSSPDTLVASWFSFSDEISGIESFEYAIGTSGIGGTETLNWTSAPPETGVFVEKALPLQNAETYYTSVRATDYAGNVSDYSVSNGITIDLTELSVISSSINTDSYLPMVDMPSLEILFSEGITPSGTTEISGNLSGSISVSMLDSSISVSFVAPFASLDTFNIRASVNDYSGKDSLTLDYTLFTDLLADYNQDLTINVQDLNEFVALWNDGNLGSDIGPFTGPIPQVTTSLDGILDLRDIMSFTRMWHWSHSTPTILERRKFSGPELIAEQDGSQIIITLPNEATSAQVVINYPIESRDFLLPESSNDERQIVLGKKEEGRGIVLVEKAYLEPRYNKKITFKAKSLDQQKAGINIHYVTFGPGGNRVSSGIKPLDIVPIPSEFAIRQNYPNPFNPLTQIRYEIPEAAHIEVIIFDLMGREVVNLLAKEVQAGYHAVQWKGQNEYGRLVGAGVYFAQLRSAGYSKTIKMLLLK